MRAKSILILACAVAWVPALFGCGGSGDGSSTGQLSLSVTDAPVDYAEALYLRIASVTLEGVQGSRDQGPFAIAEQDGLLNLMEYTGTGSAVLLSNLEVPAGTYKVRIDADLGFTAQEQRSWIAFAADSSECQEPLPAGAAWSPDQETCRYPLAIPSGEQSGFKPKGDVTVEAGGSSRFTLEFDLRRTVVDPESPLDIAYRLKPTGLRLVNDATVGTISGAVAETVFPSDCTPTDAKVYLYDRTGAEDPFVADDMHPANDSFVTSVSVEQVFAPEAGYRYLIGFVPAGTYAVALTCDAEDDPNLDQEPFAFLTTADGVQVVAGSDATQDLPPLP